MTILTLRYKEKNIKEYALVRGQHLTLGRNPDNDIVIDNPAVSGYHARIESVASSFVIRDLNSTNGIFVNKKRIQMHALQHNDLVLIGKHELWFDRMSFDRSARVDQSRNAAEDFIEDKTRFLDTSEHRELIQQAMAKNIPEPSEPVSQGNSGRTKGFLSTIVKKIFGSK